MTDEPEGVTAGVDTHRDLHVATMLDHLGRAGTEQFPANAAGYARLLDWLQRFGPVIQAGVEGTGAGECASLSRYLHEHQIRVVEVDRPDRQQRRRHGKSDPTDAIAAARAALAQEATGQPKSADADVESIRMLRIARSSAIKAKTQAANQMHSIVVTAPDHLRAQLRQLSTRALADRVSRRTR
jgi:transposase